MALFGKKEEKKEVKKQDAPKSAPAASKSSVGSRDVSYVLKHARITEKASMNQMSGVYTFDVASKATKRDIIAAVYSLYKVVPVKIAVVTIPKKIRRSARTGKTGITGGGKKAYVYLKKGETIITS